MGDEKCSQEDTVSCTFNASYSDSFHSQSLLSSINNAEMQIKRSSSYVYDLDDSLEEFEDADSLFDTLVMSSMPDLSYPQFDDTEIQGEQFRRREASAAPDFFHGSFHSLHDSCVNLLSFLSNQNEISNNYCDEQEKLKTCEPLLEESDDMAKIYPVKNNTATDSSSEMEKRSKTPVMAMNTTTSMQLATNISGTYSQSSPYDIEMELLVMPMVNDYSQMELRIPSSTLSVEKKKVLKRIAAENELTSLYTGKGKSSYLVLRKKVSLLQKQAAQKEAQLVAELERQKKLEEISKQAEELQTAPLSSFSVVSIQTESHGTDNEGNQKGIDGRKCKKAISSNTTEAPFMNAAARRKARRAAERLKAQKAQEAQMRKRESGMQTCPPNWLLCPWCTKDIPPAEQCGHIAMCRAIHRQKKQEAKAKAQLEDFRRKKQKLPLVKTGKGNDSTLQHNRERQRSRSASNRKSSRSRTRSVDANLAAALKRQTLIEAQLKEVHPNDVNGMLHAAQRVCAIPNCAHIISSTSGGQCTYCRISYCPQHRVPHTGHSCPTAPKFGKNGDSDEEDAIADRQMILKQRMRERINAMEDRRRR